MSGFAAGLLTQSGAASQENTTESTTTTPTPAPSGLIFDGGLDTGSYKPWIAPQCHNGSNPVDTSQQHFGTYTVDTQTVGQGTYSLRLDLPAWSGGRTRCQVITPRPLGVGSDDYYSLMFYLPVGFNPGTVASYAGLQIAELNYEGLCNGTANLSLQAHSSHVTLVLATGTATSVYPYCQYRSNADAKGGPNLPPLYAVPRPMQLGVWHELLIHVHWAADSTGQVDVWHRLKGRPNWRRTAHLFGYPTLQVRPDGSMPAATLDDIQAYRLASTAPTTVWLDAFSRSASSGPAAANLP